MVCTGAGGEGGEGSISSTAGILSLGIRIVSAFLRMSSCASIRALPIVIYGGEVDGYLIGPVNASSKSALFLRVALIGLIRLLCDRHSSTNRHDLK